MATHPNCIGFTKPQFVARRKRVVFRSLTPGKCPETVSIEPSLCDHVVGVAKKVYWGKSPIVVNAVR